MARVSLIICIRSRRWLWVNVASAVFSVTFVSLFIVISMAVVFIVGASLISLSIIVSGVC